MSEDQTIESLRAQNAALQKTVDVLTRRVDGMLDSSGSFEEFSRSVLLQQIVERRTTELERITESAKSETEQRKLAERSVRRKGRLLESVLAHIPHLVAWRDTQGVYKGCNPAFAEALGLDSADSIRGCTDGDLRWGAGSMALRREQFDAIVRGGDAILDEELRLDTGDGQDRTFLSSVVPMRTSAGVVQGVLSIDSDITERKKLEMELVQARKLESIGQLAAGIAHEINTPAQYVGDNIRFLQGEFGALLEALELYAKNLDPSEPGVDWSQRAREIHDALERIDIGFLVEEIPSAITQSMEGIERISSIVLSMKEFSHPGGDEKELADINRAIQSTVTVCSNRWKYVSDLDLDLDPDASRVPCLLGEFNQVVLNLIVNAVDAIESRFGDRALPGCGKIKVSTRSTGDGLRIEVRDNGGGIPETIRGQIFDPFFTTKEVGKGTGQGLAICHDVIVQKHGGTLEFDVEDGEATVFRIWLPKEAAPPAQAAA